MNLLSRLWRISDRLGKADAIVAIGIGVKSNGTLSALSLAVTKRAIYLYKKKVASKNIFTGGFTQNGISEAVAMQEVAVKDGVPLKSIILETKSSSTPTNVSETIKILKKFNFKKLVVVAQSIHARRVVALFRQQLPPSYSLFWASVESQYDKKVPNQRRLSSETRFLLWEIMWVSIYKLIGYA